MTKDNEPGQRVKMVHMEHEVISGPLKIGAYRVRDPKTGEWSKLQYHMTYNNFVVAVLEEESAKLLVRFINDDLMPKLNDSTPQDFSESKIDVMGGERVFKGTRLPVEHVRKMLERGETEANILEDYPYLTQEHLDWARTYMPPGKK